VTHLARGPWRTGSEEQVNTLLSFVAQAGDTSLNDIKHGYGGLIFTGCFFLALIVVAIWWIKRSA
jgi:hypothetical protein